MPVVLQADANPGTATWADVTTLEEVSAGVTAYLRLSAQPTAGDTVTFGADTYQFVTSGGSVTSDAFIAVTRGASTAEDAAALTAAINGTAPNPNPNVTLTDGVTPAVGIGTESIKAGDFAANLLAFGPATEQGGDTPAFGPVDLVLAETFANAGNLFVGLASNPGNYNELGARSPGVKRIARVAFTATTALINTGFFPVQLPFVPTWTQIVVTGIDGFDTIYRYPGASVPLDNTGFSSVYGPDVIEYGIPFGGGPSPDVQNGDFVVVSFFE